MSDGGNRMNCSLWRAIRHGYVKEVFRYCKTWGWSYFWHDTFRIFFVKGA